MAKAETATPTIVCPSGSLRGVHKDGLNIYTGIPFGSSTGGASRFRAPQPAPRWEGVFDATAPSTISPQRPSFAFPKLPGVPSEDCLKLNVWAPATPGPHPVFVWIHGGANTEGSCAEPLFDCAVFARDGIVAVNFNYRLGALGFLELGGLLGSSYRGSANNALLDQILALHWVLDNINTFGGDPKQVTVGGESAGAIDLCTILGSPGSSGLMRRAIIASGGQVVNDVSSADAFAKHYADILGGQDRLLIATQDEILDAQAKATMTWPQAQPWRAVLDPKTLPVKPVAAIKSGAARKVELMIGWCRDETRMMVPQEAASNPAFNPPTVAASGEQLKEAMAAYAKSNPELSQADLLWKATTAEAFGVTSLRLADAQVAAGGEVYKYRLDYTVSNGPYGDKTGHGFDVPMMFEQLHHPLAKLYGFSEAEAPMTETMHAVWSTFIRTGNVNAGLPSWPKYSENSQETMILDRRSHVEAEVDAQDRQIWHGVL